MIEVSRDEFFQVVFRSFQYGSNSIEWKRSSISVKQIALAKPKFEEYESLLSSLIGRSISEVWCGVAGLTLEIGVLQERGGSLAGEFSLWLQGRLLVGIMKKGVVLDEPFPKPDDVSILVPLINGKVVSRASIDPDNNSLRLLIDEACLLSSFPSAAVAEMPWILFDFRSAPVRNLVAYEDGFEGDLA